MREVYHASQNNATARLCGSMSDVDFTGPYLKVERADKHIREVESLLGRFVADNKKRFLPKNQQRALKEGRPIQDAKPPKHLPTALGDALHNLRVSLDHAYCILIEANGHTVTDHSRFPFGGKDWASIKGSIDGQIGAGNGPSSAVRDFIGIEVQPYPGGKHRLFDLHRLDIADKHQCILPTSAEMYLRKARLVHPVTGATVLQIDQLQMAGNKGGNFSASGYLLKAENDLKSAFDVTFGDGQPLEGERIMPTLDALRESVLDTLCGLKGIG